MSTIPKDIVAKANESIVDATKASDSTQDILLVTEPLTRCEDMLLPAPVAISLTATLILISNKQDFALREPRDGFQYLHWTSFRAAFSEIAHALQEAFRLADKNMMEICAKSKDIPKDFNRAVIIIKTAPADQMNEALQMQLDIIQNATDSCLKLAEEVEGNFIIVTNKTKELLEATINKERDTEEEIKRIEKTRKGIDEAEKLAEIRKKENEVRLKEIEKKVDEADQMFKNTFTDADKMVIGMAIAENVAQVVKTGITTCAPCLLARQQGNVGSSLTNALPTILELGKTAVEIGKDAVHQVRNVDNNIDDDGFEDLSGASNKECAKISAYSKADKMLELAGKLFEFVNEDDKIGDDVISAQDYESYKQQYAELKRSLSDSAGMSKNARRALDLCAEGWTICSELKKLRKTPEKVNQKVLCEKIKKLDYNCKEFSAKGKKYLGGEVSLKKMAMKKGKACANATATNAAVNHAHYKLELSLAYLKTKQEEFDKAQEERMQLLAEATERAQQIQNMDIDKVEYNKVRDCLIEGLEVLGYLREQWKCLAQFFQNMSYLIRMASGTADKFRQLALLDSKSSQQNHFLREFIYDEAFEAVKLAVTVRQLSNCYSQISQKFLMPQVNALDLFYSIRNQQSQFEANQKLLMNRTEAQIGIRQIIENERKELCIAMNKRRDQLEAIKSTLEPLIPIKEVEENKMLAQTVTNAVEEEDDDDELTAIDIQKRFCIE